MTKFDFICYVCKRKCNLTPKQRRSKYIKRTCSKKCARVYWMGQIKLNSHKTYWRIRKTKKFKDYQKRYHNSRAYKKRIKAYHQSEGYKERIKVYRQTEKYKENQKKYRKKKNGNK